MAQGGSRPRGAEKMMSAGEQGCHGGRKSHFDWYLKLCTLEEVPDDLAQRHRQAAENRFEQSRPFLESIPLGQVRRVLDVGLGYGQHCRWFAAQGKEALGIAINLPAQLSREAAEHGYCVREMDMHLLDLPDGSFDLVWSHHSLEHSYSPFAALLEWRRVLRPGGYLAVTVPPHKTQVVSGHFIVGWSIGQLAYVLCCTGYDVEHGSFVRQGYNVRALVKKLEPFDPEGISWIFKTSRFLPEPLRGSLQVHTRSLGRYSFEGDLLALSADSCVPARSRAASPARLSLFGRLRAACKLLLKGSL